MRMLHEDLVDRLKTIGEGLDGSRVTTDRRGTHDRATITITTLTAGVGSFLTVANIGRNDPCPCGSGRKYKHCCLGQVDAERATRVRLRQAEARIVPALLEFALDRWGKELLAQAWDEFVFDAEELPDDLIGDPDFYPFFLPWFVFCFVPDPNAEDPLPNAPTTPIADVYRSEGKATDHLDRRLVESASGASFSFHVVERTDARLAHAERHPDGQYRAGARRQRNDADRAGKYPVRIPRDG